MKKTITVAAMMLILTAAFAGCSQEEKTKEPETIVCGDMNVCCRETLSADQNYIYAPLHLFTCDPDPKLEITGFEGENVNEADWTVVEPEKDGPFTNLLYRDYYHNWFTVKLSPTVLPANVTAMTIKVNGEEHRVEYSYPLCCKGSDVNNDAAADSVHLLTAPAMAFTNSFLELAPVFEFTAVGDITLTGFSLTYPLAAADAKVVVIIKPDVEPVTGNLNDLAPLGIPAGAEFQITFKGECAEDIGFNRLWSAYTNWRLDYNDASGKALSLSNYFMVSPIGGEDDVKALLDFELADKNAVRAAEDVGQ